MTELNPESHHMRSLLSVFKQPGKFLICLSVGQLVLSYALVGGSKFKIQGNYFSTRYQQQPPSSVLPSRPLPPLPAAARAVSAAARVAMEAEDTEAACSLGSDLACW